MGMSRSSKAGAQLFIGTSGYSYPDWKGIVYPLSVKRDVGGSTPELSYHQTLRESLVNPFCPK